MTKLNYLLNKKSHSISKEFTKVTEMSLVTGPVGDRGFALSKEVWKRKKHEKKLFFSNCDFININLVLLYTSWHIYTSLS